MNRIHCWAIALLAGMNCALFGQSVPQLINYQGRLANPDGSPFPTSDYELKFSIYDAPTNGTLIWGPQTFDGGAGQGRGLRIPVMQGFFSVMLGPMDTNGRPLLDAFSSSNRFVEVTVSDRPPILPRQQILSTPYAIQAANGSPPGTIVAFGGDAIPEGWILCDGRPLRTGDYPRLFAAIGSRWGDASDDADSTTNFRAPDFRGLFLRGVDDSPLMGTANRDPDRGDAIRGQIATGSAYGNRVGSWQGDNFAAHQHRPIDKPIVQSHLLSISTSSGAGLIYDGAAAQVDSGLLTSVTGGNETRPKNAYVNYIIKY